MSKLFESKHKNESNWTKGVKENMRKINENKGVEVLDTVHKPNGKVIALVKWNNEYVVAYGFNAKTNDWQQGSYYQSEEQARKKFYKVLMESTKLNEATDGINEKDIRVVYLYPRSGAHLTPVILNEEPYSAQDALERAVEAALEQGKGGSIGFISFEEMAEYFEQDAEALEMYEDVFDYADANMELYIDTPQGQGFIDSYNIKFGDAAEADELMADDRPNIITESKVINEATDNDVFITLLKGKFGEDLTFEYYTDYSDMLDAGDITKIMDAENSEEYYFDKYNEVSLGFYEDYDDYVNPALEEIIAENPELFSEEGSRDKLYDLARDNVFGKIPEYLDQSSEFFVVFGTSKDRNYDFTLNPDYTRYESLEEAIELLSGSFLEKLIVSQGYNLETFAGLLMGELSMEDFPEYKNSKFINSLIGEITDNTSGMTGVTVLGTAEIIEAINLKDGNARITLNPNDTIGLFDGWSGSGSNFDILLEVPYSVDPSDVFYINSAYARNSYLYSPDNVYSFSSSIYHSHLKIDNAEINETRKQGAKEMRRLKEASSEAKRLVKSVPVELQGLITEADLDYALETIGLEIKEIRKFFREYNSKKDVRTIFTYLISKGNEVTDILSITPFDLYVDVIEAESDEDYVKKVRAEFGSEIEDKTDEELIHDARQVVDEDGIRVYLRDYDEAFSGNNIITEASSIKETSGIPYGTKYVKYKDKSNGLTWEKGNLYGDPLSDDLIDMLNNRIEYGEIEILLKEAKSIKEATEQNLKELVSAAYYMTQYASYQSDEGFYEALIEYVSDWDDSNIDSLVQIFNFAPEVSDQINQLLFDGLFQITESNIDEISDLYNEITSNKETAFYANYLVWDSAVDSIDDLVYKVNKNYDTVIFADSYEVLAMDIVEEIGFENLNNPENYFDYESFGNHLYNNDFIEDEIRNALYNYDEELVEEIISDQEIPEDAELDEYDRKHVEELLKLLGSDNYSNIADYYIDMLGGIEQLDKETIENYFDYESFGNDLTYDYIEYEYGGLNGYIGRY